MKKIISLLATVAMLATMSVTTFASNEAPFSMTVDKTNIELAAEGTETVNVTATFKFDTDTVISSAAIAFDTDGLAVSGMEYSELTAYIPKDGTFSDEANGMVTCIDMTNFATATIPANTEVDITATLTVDKTVAKTYNVTLTGDTLILGDDFETPINDGVTYPTATITVAAPAPDKTDVVVAPVASYDKSDAFEKDGAEYYHAAFKKEITVTADNNAVAGLKLEADKEVDVMFDTVVKDGTVNVAINILNVPADATLGTITITPIAE